jgi:hypothetical protein
VNVTPKLLQILEHVFYRSLYDENVNTLQL